MMLAGLFVADDNVLELARLIDDEHLEMRLRSALARNVKVLGLSIDERDLILRALIDCPPALAELHGVLLQEHTWRQREGRLNRPFAEQLPRRSAGLVQTTRSPGLSVSTAYGQRLRRGRSRSPRKESCDDAVSDLVLQWRDGPHPA